MPAAPQPTPSAGYSFSGVAPTATSSSQGDMPIYARPGASNVVYGSTYASSLAAGGTPDLVGWSFLKPAGGLFSGLSQKLGTAGQQGLTYYTLPGALEQWGQMTPDQRVTVQKQLLASGMYDASYYPSAAGTTAKKPLYGAIADHDTILALSNAWSAAKSTGQTLDAVLSQANASAMNAARIYQQNTQVGIFDQSDPAELRGLADQQAVNVLGRKATADEKALAVSMVQAAQVAFQQGPFNQKVAANRADAAVQLAGGIGGTLGGPTGSSIAGGGTPSTVNALVSALGGQETTSPTPGGYTTVNPDSGATGRFQIMPGNWPKWSEAAGLGPNAPMTPQNQEIVARNQISIYLADGHGDPGYVAVAWYAGEETAKAFQADPSNPKWKTPIGVSGKPDPNGKYPSIAGYAQSVTSKMAAAIPGTLATQSMAGNVGNLPADGSGGPGNAGSINVGQTPSPGVPSGPAIPTTGSSLAGERGSIGVTAGTGSGLTGTNTGAGQVAGTGTTVTAGQPTPAQLLPASTGIYTQVNPSADIAEMLRQNNPQTAGAHDLASVLDAVRQLFHG